MSLSTAPGAHGAVSDLRMMQMAVGGILSAMGLAQLLMPEVTLPLTIKPDVLTAYGGVTPTLNLLTRCLGGASVLCGVTVAASEFTSVTWKAMGITLAPLLGLDWVAWNGDNYTPFGAASIMASKAACLGLSWFGYKRAKEREDKFPGLTVVRP